MAYQSPDMNEMQFQQPSPPVPDVPPTPKKVGLRAAVLCLIFLLAAVVIVHETLLQISYVTVVGNVHISREEVIASAGLSGRVSYLAIREDDIREGVNHHFYLEYEGMEKHFPNGLTLYIRERIPAVNLTVMDEQYITDEKGYVLEKCESKQPDNGLVHVTGMTFKRLTVGENVVPVSESQLQAMQTVIAEMQVQKCLSQFSELNVGNVENLYLVTVDGFSVNIGDMQDVRGKLLTVRGVLSSLREGGYAPGSLEAMVPGYATYTPPDM